MIAMNIKGQPSLRQIQLVLLSLTVALVILTFQYQIKSVSLLHNDTKPSANTSGMTVSFRDNYYEINKVKGVYVGKSIEVSVGKSVQKANKHHTKEVCSHNSCKNGNKTHTNVCRKYLATIGDNVFSIKNENMCMSGDGTKGIVVLVHSATNNFERRTAIRQTWGNLTQLKTYNLKVVYILGQPNNKTLQTLINHENTLHADIVQGKFMDTYHNLSQKHVLGLRWVSEYCKTAKYVIKVDDDVFLNPFGFFRDLVTKYPNITRTIMCNVRLNGTDRILRGGGPKWGVNVNIFKNQTHWPFTFCQGYVIIYTSDIVPEIYNAATSICTPFVWLDDVYVTGILARNVGNIRHSGLKGISQHVIYIHKSLTKNMHQHWTYVLGLTKQPRGTTKKDAELKLNVTKEKKKMQ